MSLPPRVSILIPNFNNGRASSRSGQRDFIADLFHSLDETLCEETTAFEVLAFDDGSTDDSIDTLREWAANRTWPDGRPFLTLTEAPHCGILAITANKLSGAARGEYLARLDGDIVCLTPNWVSRLCAIFDQGPPNLGIIGPKQLNVHGLIHEFGDWLLHPNGYHHNGHGLPRQAATCAQEVDDTMGCFYCCRKRVWEEIGGYDETFLRGQTVDFGLRARLAGWRCWAVPDIEYIHAHSERGDRQTTADSSAGLQKSIDRFEEKWGFSRLAPDLDYVRDKFAGTPLLWNPKWFGTGVSESGASRRVFAGDSASRRVLAARSRATDSTRVHAMERRARPRIEDDAARELMISPDHTDWKRYRSDAGLRAAIEFRVKVALDVVKQIGPRRLAVHVGSDCGVFGHLLAAQGLPYLGLDERTEMVALAGAMTQREKYPNAAPRFEHLADRRRLPLDDESADLALLFDVVERHPNPVSLFNETARILTPGGIVIVVSKRAQPALENMTDLEHPYTFHQLATQMLLTGAFKAIIDAKRDDPSREILIAMQRLPREQWACRVASRDEAARVPAPQRGGSAVAV